MIERNLAVKCMVETKKGGYSQIVFGNYAKKCENVAFLSALFYGTLERKLNIDKAIKKYVSKKLDDEVLAVLELGFYELAFMNTPDYAVINEYVNLTRKIGKTSASGLVNAVLHKFDKILSQDSLSDIGSCTKSIAEALEKWYGYENAKKFLLSSFGRPKLYKRINSIKVKEGPYCVEITDGKVLGEDFNKGLYHIQDKASQNAALALGAKPGERILDCCSAPGSKSYVIAQEMQNKGQIISCDLVPSRVEKIKEGANRLGITIIDARVCDATKENPELGMFDRILCDVPCSGLGVINRKPEIKQKEMREFESLIKLQQDIAKMALTHLKPGGTFVYSTCTVNPDENMLKDVTGLELISKTENVLEEGFYISVYKKL